MTATVAVDYLNRARAARDAGKLDNCLQHGQVAIALADVEEDRDTGFHAHACMGRMYMSRSEPEQAAVWYAQAKEYAMEYGLAQWLPYACHDLYLAYSETGEREKAWRARAAATELYPARCLSRLTADVSLEEMRRGSGGHAYHAFRAVSDDCAKNDRDRLVTLENLTNAASMVGTMLFDRHWNSFREELIWRTTGESITRVYLVGAEAGLRRDRREEAARLAERAKGLAEARQEPANVARAEYLLSEADSARVFR